MEKGRTLVSFLLQRHLVKGPEPWIMHTSPSPSQIKGESTAVEKVWVGMKSIDGRGDQDDSMGGQVPNEPAWTTCIDLLNTQFSMGDPGYKERSKEGVEKPTVGSVELKKPNERQG